MRGVPAARMGTGNEMAARFGALGIDPKSHS
jgi:hypothetical protein